MHVVQRLAYLDCEPLGQSYREALEIVILDKLIQVNTKYFENDAYMAPKSEFLFYSYNILWIFMIIIPKGLQNFNFDFALFM